MWIVKVKVKVFAASMIVMMRHAVTWHSAIHLTSKQASTTREHQHHHRPSNPIMTRPNRRRKNPPSIPSSSSPSAIAKPSAPTPTQQTLMTSDTPEHEHIKRIDARPHLERGANGFQKPSTALFSALAQCTVPAWAWTATMISLIFGGCCSNVRLFAPVQAPNCDPSFRRCFCSCGEYNL